MLYTLKTLAKSNQSFNRQYGVNQSDVEKINHLVSLIESRQGNILQIGDVVEYTNKYGEYFQMAAIDSIEENSVHICESARINIGEINNKLSYSLSGGSFNHVSMENFTYNWEDETQEFYARMSAQNKIIDSYKVDYFINEENKIALEELRSGKVKPLKLKFEED